ncbi:MAG: tetratricopeptide repeat protein [Myxococcales bacterium]|nr:tetratricopeptide repeat protein [Myxococcales bacterium]
MTPSERSELEARADRCVRRGELADALGLYQAITAAFPDEPAVLRKIDQLRESLQPAELNSAKVAFEPGAGLTETLEAQAERLFSLGDYPGAIAAYRRALKAKPDNELIRERLAELFRLAQDAPPRATEPSLPQEPVSMLQALLDRVSSRRRG